MAWETRVPLIAGRVPGLGAAGYGLVGGSGLALLLSVVALWPTWTLHDSAFVIVLDRRKLSLEEVKCVLLA